MVLNPCVAKWSWNRGKEADVAAMGMLVFQCGQGFGMESRIGEILVDLWSLVVEFGCVDGRVLGGV